MSVEGIVGALRKALAHGRDGHSDDIPLARSGALQTDPLLPGTKEGTSVEARPEEAGAYRCERGQRLPCSPAPLGNTG